MALNEVEYGELSSKLGEINELADVVRTNLNAINDLIDSTVETDVWYGESASQFKASWVELADDFNSFIDAFKKQGMNVASLLSKTSAADTEGSVSEQ